MTTLVHGAAHTAAVQAASEALFGKGDVHALDARTLTDATAELPGGEVSVGTTLTDALVAVGLVDSRNAARRAIGDGGASLNNVKITDAEAVLGRRTSCTDRSPCCVAAARPSPPAGGGPDRLRQRAEASDARTTNQERTVPAPRAVLFSPQAADLRICVLARTSLYCSLRQPDREERTPPRWRRKPRSKQAGPGADSTTRRPRFRP